jgi:hypothetical protein
MINARRLTVANPDGEAVLVWRMSQALVVAGAPVCRQTVAVASRDRSRTGVGRYPR